MYQLTRRADEDLTRILRYGIEQQAEIVKHRFYADRGAKIAQVPPADLLPFQRG